MRNTSMDLLEGVTLNITEMNLAGSIPVKILSDNSTNNTLGWHNWTTSQKDDPVFGRDELDDLFYNIQLPSNETNSTILANRTLNATLAAMNATNGTANATSEGDNMMGKKKTKLIGSNSTMNETIHIAIMEP